MLRRNKEIDELIANDNNFDNVLCFIKNNGGEVHPYYIIQCQYSSLKNINDGLNFVTQIWKWSTNVMIQMPFIDGTYSSVK